jgi:hypothetical protein
MTMVTLADLRACHYCARGARAFAARHRLDWGAFRRDGVPAEVLIATGDDMALTVVRRARERERQG